jgi:hypothetical protein
MYVGPSIRSCVVNNRRSPMPEQTNEDRPSPGMKLVSLRMSEDAWEYVQREARAAGVSASEFIREATYLRLGYRWARRFDDDEVMVRLKKLGVLREIDF